MKLRELKSHSMMIAFELFHFLFGMSILVLKVVCSATSLVFAINTSLQLSVSGLSTAKAYHVTRNHSEFYTTSIPFLT